MSENNYATLDKVYPRWKAIEDHISTSMLPVNHFSEYFKEYRNRPGKCDWKERKAAQFLTIHTTAYIYCPLSINQQISLQMKKWSRKTSWNNEASFNSTSSANIDAKKAFSTSHCHVGIRCLNLFSVGSTLYLTMESSQHNCYLN